MEDRDGSASSSSEGQDQPTAGSSGDQTAEGSGAAEGGESGGSSSEASDNPGEDDE